MECKVKDLVNINKNSLKKSELEKKEFIRYLDTANITRGKIDNISELTVGKDKIPSRARRKVTTNDIIISTVRPNQEHYGIIDKSIEDVIVSTGFAVLSPDSSLVDPYYLYLKLTSQEITKKLQMIAEDSTSTYPSIKPNVLGDVSLNLPNLRTQNIISKFIKSLDTKIKLNYKIIANLEELSQTLFKRWFVDFEFPDENGNPYKSSGGEMKKHENESLPSDWVDKKLKNIINISSGKRPKVKNDVKFGNMQYPIIGASKIMGYTNDYLYDERIIVTGRVGTHGIIQKFNEKVWPSDNSFVIISDYFNFTENILKNIDFKSLNRGSTQPLITQTDLKNLKIFVPKDMELIRAFENIFKVQTNLIFNLTKENIHLKRLRDTLLPKLISGELKLPEELEV